jgi:DNA helicase HerA-like ATPase
VFLEQIGGDLYESPDLAPTLDEFLTIGLEILAEPAAGTAGGLSEFTREAIEHFARQFANLRRSALYSMLSTDRGDLKPIDALFGHTHLVEFAEWRDEREVNAALGLIFAMLFEKRQSEDYEQRFIGDGVGAAQPNDAVRLRHVVVLDEAHRIFPADNRGGDERLVSGSREVSSLMGHMLAECRALGQGVVVAEQSASKIDAAALINTGTKIIHGVVYGKDKEFLGSALSLSSREQDYISYLQRGEALAVLPGIRQPLFLTVTEVEHWKPFKAQALP